MSACWPFKVKGNWKFLQYVALQLQEEFENLKD